MIFVVIILIHYCHHKHTGFIAQVVLLYLVILLAIYLKGILHRFFILNYVIPLLKTSWYIPLLSQCAHSIALVRETLWSHLT